MHTSPTFPRKAQISRAADGSHEAFLRLQQEIWKCSRDYSIFAWGMSKDFRTISPDETRSGSYGFQSDFAEQFFPELNPEQPKPLRLFSYLATSPGDFLLSGNIVHLQNWPRNNSAPSQHSNDIGLCLPVIHGGRLFDKFVAWIELLGCKVQDTGSMICLLTLSSQNMSPGRIRAPVAIQLHQWAPWRYDDIAIGLMGITTICRNGIINNTPSMLKVVVEFEKLHREQGYCLTQTRCASTAHFKSSTTSTKIQIYDLLEGRLCYLLFETDDVSGDPFVVIVGIFGTPNGGYTTRRALIRAQWISRTSDSIRFMEKGLAHPYVSFVVPIIRRKLDAYAQIKHTVNAEGLLADRIMYCEGNFPRALELNHWSEDIDLYPRSDWKDIISCCVRDSMLSVLSGSHDEFLLQIECIGSPRLEADRRFWAADSYDYISIHDAQEEPVSHPAMTDVIQPQKTSPKHSVNTPELSSSPKEANDTSLRSYIDAACPSEMETKTKTMTNDNTDDNGRISSANSSITSDFMQLLLQADQSSKLSIQSPNLKPK